MSSVDFLDKHWTLAWASWGLAQLAIAGLGLVWPPFFLLTGVVIFAPLFVLD